MTVDVYFRMLAGEGYTKSQFRRGVERDVGRSSGAIEYKFNNVSVVLDELGAVWIPGYKPLRNVQDGLRTVVRERFKSDSDLRAIMLKAVADGDVAPTKLRAEVDPPSADWPAGRGPRVEIVDFDLAAEVRHVSVVDGDGFGYDVLSFRGSPTKRPMSRSRRPGTARKCPTSSRGMRSRRQSI